MNTKVKNIIFAIIIFLQFSYVNLNAEEVKSVDDEELPATDPFIGSVTVTESIVETDSSAGDIMNNMRLIATVSGAHKKIAVLATPDGRAAKYEENEFIFENLLLVEINSDYIVVSPNEGEEHEVYLTGQIKPREGNY